MIEGSKTDSRQPMVGVPMSVSIADLALSRADFIAVGHVHAEQEFEYGGTPIVVPGCPYHRNFGEPGPTSYVIGDFEGKVVSWTRIPVPARPMLLMSAEFEDNGLRWIEEDVTGAEVRLRISVPADSREAARHAANELREELLRRGAVMVKVEEQVDASVRARAPEVATAATLEDKLRAYWKAKCIELGDREPRVLGRLGGVTT
jgi:DNA repair exonuclease SbcCD nuclease subunit